MIPDDGIIYNSYKIVERENLAILYFTSTPFMSPHIFIKENGKWQMDILAEVYNTREMGSGVFT